MSLYERNSNGPTLKLLIAVAAIVLGFLTYFDVVHVGVGHKGFGTVEVIIGLLAL